MYFPYLRGKQNELILLRENAELIAGSDIIPIIEPVKSNLNPLKKSLDELGKNKARFIVVANPDHGDYHNNGYGHLDALITEEDGREGLILGFIFNKDTSIEDFKKLASAYPEMEKAIIHYGYSDGAALRSALKGVQNLSFHIFIEQYSQKRYRRNFSNGDTQRILIRDGFIKRNNRDHPSSEHFTELHIMYQEEGMDGFGDFLITGDEYSESGGPAYAVAIHLTYMDPDDEYDMYIKHYVSDRNKSPTDPGGKFIEALSKLVGDVNSNRKILHSDAVHEFINLHEKQHFPGLGVVKKLSMQHHLELIADFLARN